MAVSKPAGALGRWGAGAKNTRIILNIKNRGTDKMGIPRGFTNKMR